MVDGGGDAVGHEVTPEPLAAEPLVAHDAGQRVGLEGGHGAGGPVERVLKQQEQHFDSYQIELCNVMAFRVTTYGAL